MTDNSLLRAVAERGTPAAERNQLQRFDWLQQALEIFVAEGIDAIRITRLADDLDVTRGSFYWHFQNRDDLIESLVSLLERQEHGRHYRIRWRRHRASRTASSAFRNLH